MAAKVLMRAPPQIVVCGPRARQSVFTRVGDPHIFLSDDSAIEWFADAMGHGHASESCKLARAHLITEA